MATLSGREWLHRIWTFQEVILAPNPTLSCGYATIIWADFYHGMAFYSEKTSSVPFYSLKSPRRPNPWLALSSVRALHEEWFSLARIWASTPRLSEWHGRVFRQLPDKKDLSASEYQDQVVRIAPGLNPMIKGTSLLFCVLAVLPLILFSFIFLKLGPIGQDPGMG